MDGSAHGRRFRRCRFRLRRPGSRRTAWTLALLPLLWPLPGGRDPDPADRRAPAADAAPVYLLELSGIINPLTARYLERGLGEAVAAGATLVVLTLNTPGGLEPSMRQMTTSILNSPVPIVVHVAPSGARAASAGMFIVLAGHIAAMAPGTNIGAAHPVGLGPAAADTAVIEKLVSDAAALARSLAEIRGRDPVWPEEAVRQSVSITASEALERGVIDLVADDRDSLLRALDGQDVPTAAGPRVIRTTGASLVERPMTFPERILQAITDPNVAFLLFTIGVIGVIAELYNPGAIFPGLVGVLSLILAFVAFGSLPVNWAGIILLLLGIGLFILDLYAEGVGALSVAGLIVFVLGALMLYTPFSPPSPAMPAVRVSPWLVAGMAAGIGAFFGLILRALLRTRGAPVAIGVQALVGRTGVALGDLAPEGPVRVDSEAWSAVADRPPIRAGEAVRVVAVEGVILRVSRTDDRAGAAPRVPGG